VRFGMGILAILAISGADSGAYAQTRPCLACETRLELSVSQWGCLDRYVKLYLGKSYDPVLIAVDCVSEPARTELPNTAARSAAGGRAQPLRTLLLSQAQLRCLDKLIPTLPVAELSKPVVLDAACLNIASESPPNG